MATITDEFMKEMLAKAKHYALVVLRDGPNMDKPDMKKVIWEHGRRNFALRKNGLLSIVCPVSSEGSLAGIAIFNAPVDKVKQIMAEDPAVKSGALTYEVLDCRSFPGDRLP